jgi:hypothetical protein
MAVHVICPSLRCRKILTLNDEVRGNLVSCRYCNMEFRVPALRRPVVAPAPRVRAAK